MSDGAHSGESPPSPSPTPYFEALEAARYQRQTMMREYEREFGVTLIAYHDLIFPRAITPFQDALYDADREKDLHLLLASEGGDGETAVRLVRAAQAHCRELTVIVNPDRDEATASDLGKQLENPLIRGSQSHGALFGLTEARDTDLPVRALDPEGDHWRLVWRLWTRYVALGVTAYEGNAIYEGRRASHIIER